MKKTEKTAATAKKGSKSDIYDKLKAYAEITKNKKQAEELAAEIKKYAMDHEKELFVGKTWTTGVDGLKVTKVTRTTATIDQSKLMGKHIATLKRSQSRDCFTLKIDPKKVVHGDKVASAVLDELDYKQVSTDTFSLVTK